MKTNKWPVTVASAYVMKMRAEVCDLNKDLFLQLNKWSIDSAADPKSQDAQKKS